MYKVMEKYSQYDMRYDIVDRILFIYNAILVSELVDIRNMLRGCDVEIRVMGGR